MNRSGKLHQADEHESAAAHRGAARAGLRKVKAIRNAAPAAHTDAEQQRPGSSKSGVRTGIVSVNGRDVGEMRCTGGHHRA